MAEVDILMQEKQDDGSYNQLYPITKASNVNYTNSALSGVSNAQQGLDSIVNTLGDINLNNYFTKTQTLTSSTAALFGLGTDAVPDDVLALLSKAALYRTSSRYKKQLSDINEGDIILLNENGFPVQFYVAKKNYESGYNSNRVLIVRKEIAQNGYWNTSGTNAYSGSTIDSWFNNTYFQKLDAEVRAAISTTNIPYTPMNGNTSIKRTSKSIFALSASEYGHSSSVYPFNVEGSATYMEKVDFPSGVWTRTPQTNITLAAIERIPGIRYSSSNVSATNAGYVPAFTLPSTFEVYTYNEGIYDVSDNLLLKLPGVQIATGSYVGTGKYGPDNPNSLTFEFDARILIISAYTSSSGYSYSTDFFVPNILKIQSGSSIEWHDGADEYELHSINFSGRKIDWYSSESAIAQLNESGYEYFYTVLG